MELLKRKKVGCKDVFNFCKKAEKSIKKSIHKKMLEYKKKDKVFAKISEKDLKKFEDAFLNLFLCNCKRDLKTKWKKTKEMLIDLLEKGADYHTLDLFKLDFKYAIVENIPKIIKDDVYLAIGVRKQIEEILDELWLDLLETYFKKTNEKIKESEERLRNLMNAIAEGFVFLDTKSRVVEINDMARKILCKDINQDVKGKTIKLCKVKNSKLLKETIETINNCKRKQAVLYAEIDNKKYEFRLVKVKNKGKTIGCAINIIPR